MNRLPFLVVALLIAVPAIAETRKYGPLILDFGRAQKMGDSIVVPLNETPKDFDLTALTSDIITILTNLVAITVIIDNNNFFKYLAVLYPMITIDNDFIFKN